jgi:hypothetical protein
VSVAAFFYGESRYRVPYDPMLIIVATIGLATLARNLRRFWATERRRPA